MSPFEAPDDQGPHAWIRYDEHPAYAGHAAGLIGRIRATATFLKYFAVILCKRTISYELIPADVRKHGGMPFAAAAFANVRRRFLGGRPAPVTPDSRPVTDALVRDGICVLGIEPAAFSVIATEATPVLEGLRKSRGERKAGGRDFAESRASALRATNHELFRAVDSMLWESGALAGIPAYIGREARLIDVNPQINDTTDDFWARIFLLSSAPAASCIRMRPGASLRR